MSVEEPITDFAARVGASRQTLYRIISRSQVPKPTLARLIVEATGSAVSWEALYQNAQPAPEERAGDAPGLDRARLKTAIAAVYDHFAPQGAASATDVLLGTGVKAVVEIHEALSVLSDRSDREHLGQALRSVLECVLSRGGTRLPPMAVDRTVKLGVDLYFQPP